MARVGTALIFDTETTGIPDWRAPADADGQPRMLSLAASLIDEGGGELERFKALVKPEDFEIDEMSEAFNINQLSNELLQAQGIPMKEVLDAYDDMMDRCEFVAAFNIRFDQKIVRGEMRRAQRDDRYGYRDTFDVMFKARKLACRTASPHSDPKSLEHCYRNIIGMEMQDAHEAEADLNATIDIYRMLLLEDLVEPKQQESKR